VVDNRVVAARIKNDDFDAVSALNCSANVIERYHLIAQADLVFELPIDRHQIVSALILKSMAGVKEQGGIGIRRQTRKLSHRNIELALAGINGQDYLKIQ